MRTSRPYAAMVVTMIMLLAAAVVGPQQRAEAAATDPIAHDPTMIKEGPYYYVFITGDSGTPNTYIPVKRSTDLVHWQELGPVFTTPPQWVVDALGITPHDFWAPDINYFNGRYYLYYAASRFGVNDSVIGLATNTTLDPSSPDYHWVDQGMVLRSQQSDSFNAIDPELTVDTSGVPWLAFGSFWSGILMRRLDPATGKPSSEDPTMYPLVDRHWPPNAVEGASITRHGGYYYLFASFDYCCRAADSDYRVVVGRSVDVTGPYVDETGQPLLNGGGTEVLRGYNEFAGPGGGDVSVDGSTYRYVHHYYDITDNGAPKLSIRQITWSNGWPVLGDPVSGSVEVGHGPAPMQLIEMTTGELISAAPGGSSAPLCGYEGANVQLATDSGSPCQQWQLKYAGDGYYGLLSRHSNKVVDVTSCGYADGTNIGQWGWLDNDCQKYRFVPGTDGWLRLQNKNQPGGQQGKFIDAGQLCDGAGGANIQLWSFGADRCQQFRLQPVGDVLLLNAGSGKVLDVAGCGDSTGVNVIQHGRRPSDCQLWRFAHTDGTYFHIVNEKSGHPLRIAGCGDGGTNVVVQPRGSDTCAQWRLEPLNTGSALIDGGSFRLVNRGTQQVVGVDGCTSADAVNVATEAWTGGTCQQFKIVIP
ncbi:MAG: family 43 glycosylhydrolase [Microlunatus sp.]|nr:family 43 glycosylhydrolase [Microlunatus sp.]